MRKTTSSILLFLLLAGSFLAGSWYTRWTVTKNGVTSGRKVLYFVDPMHPAYKSDRPGIAPDCGMQLEPVYADGDLATSGQERQSSILPPGTVKISPEKQQIMGVRVSPVEKESGSHTLRVLGRVAPNETLVYKLVAGVEGYIREVAPVTTGSQVEKDQLLATFSAPEARGPIQAFLVTLDVLARGDTAGADAPAQINASTQSFQIAVDRLLNAGLSTVQIEEIKRSRQVPIDFKILAPATGFVLARNVSPGLKFERGSEWYRIGDLRRVWILADIFGREAKMVRSGVTARVSLPDQDLEFQAIVSDVLPEFDPATRTLKVRLEVDNPTYALRPDMFVDVELPVTLPSAITVPVDAVLDSGLKKTVFVERESGFFEPRTVATGARFDDRIEIIRGLASGERVVVSGNFLIDSESRMKLAGAGLFGNLNKDPVCGMDVSETKVKAAGRTMKVQGKTYYFCSDSCKEQFRQEPGRFLQKEATGGSVAGESAAGDSSDATRAGKAQQKAAVLRDPVCGMEVKESEAETAGLKSEHLARTYYFCSAHCKQEFDKDSERYAEKKTGGERQHD